MRRLALALGGLVAAAATTLAPTGVAAAAATGTVYVVHGIPDTPVDVYVDGKRALDDFKPGTAEGPLSLPAGPHEVKIFAADAKDDSGKPVLEANASVPAGGNVTLVAHLKENGDPTITPFVDDVSRIAPGEARLVVRHTAAAPAVDVLAGGKAVIEGLKNPEQKVLNIPAGTVSASVAAAGTTDPVIGPADLDLAEGTATFVHAIGSLDKKNLSLVSFTIKGLHSAPHGVPSGAPSGAPSEDGAPFGLAVAGAALALVAGAAGLRRRAAGAGR